MNLVNIEDNKNNVIVKHQELVRTARYRLSELGIKVVSVLISMIKVSDEAFKEYAIKVNDFKELIGSDSKKTYEYVDVMTDELMKKPFKIGDEKFNWVYYARYHKGDNYVTLKIAPELKPYLLELQGKFLQYNIANILPLKSGYVIRLYELCKDHYVEATRYKKNKKSVQFELKIERMRELFEIPASYQYSSHIKKHIIDKAVQQFKDKTDIQISYKEQKIGRKVDRIIITVKENNKGSNDYLNDIHKFIRHIRRHYINTVLIETMDKYTQQKIKLSVDKDGKLYNQRDHTPIPADRSQEMWNTLYSLAEEDKLLCLKQGSLIDAQTPMIETKPPKINNKEPEKKKREKKNPNITTLEDIDIEKMNKITLGFKGFASDQERQREIFKFIVYNQNKHGDKAMKNWIDLFVMWLTNNKNLHQLGTFYEEVE